MTELLFHNARVLTMDTARPQAEAVAVRDGRIVAVGSAQDAAAALDGAERIDCAGGDLLPAFIDAHCHVLSYAASLRLVDCTDARSIAEIQDAIRARVAASPPGAWVRAFGYEETSLAEDRHPTRHDLDAVSPEHPVRLVHGSGHASVLNSLALRIAGIGNETEEPPGGALERDLDTGGPTGVLLGMEHVVEGLVPPLAYGELAETVREAGSQWHAAGVTCVQDAPHTNGREAWDLFERLIEDGSLPLDIVFMEGLEHLGGVPETASGGRLRRGAVKLMLHELGPELIPDEAELARQVWQVHAAGRQVAIHAVSRRAVAAAANAIEAALQREPRSGHRHRIEHGSHLPDGLAPRLAKLGIVVASQPSLVYERGERYLQLVPQEEQSGLYAFRTLQDAGVVLAAGSDAPVTSISPLASVAAAVDRRTEEGGLVAPEQAVAIEDALSWWTAGAARAAFLEGERGAIAAGRCADLVLLPAGTLDRPAGELREAPAGRLWCQGNEVALEAKGP